jgi:steroid delta-isomerase-like uncharacterized protein
MASDKIYIREANTLDNKAIVKHFVDVVWHAKQFDMIDALCAPTFIPHGLPAGIPATRDGFKQAANAMHHVFPDIHYTIEDIIEENGKVVLRWNATATHQGDLMGITATHKPVKRSGISIYHVQDEKIVEWWPASDMLPVLVQIGAITLPFS